MLRRTSKDVTQKLIRQLKVFEYLGKLGEGERFLSVREISRRYHIAPNTAYLILARLQDLGLIEMKSRSGTYLCPRRPLAAASKLPRSGARLALQTLRRARLFGVEIDELIDLLLVSKESHRAGFPARRETLEIVQLELRKELNIELIQLPLDIRATEDIEALKDCSLILADYANQAMAPALAELCGKPLLRIRLRYAGIRQMLEPKDHAPHFIVRRDAETARYLEGLLEDTFDEFPGVRVLSMEEDTELIGELADEGFFYVSPVCFRAFRNTFPNIQKCSPFPPLIDPSFVVDLILELSKLRRQSGNMPASRFRISPITPVHG